MAGEIILDEFVLSFMACGICKGRDTHGQYSNTAEVKGWSCYLFSYHKQPVHTSAQESVWTDAVRTGSNDLVM